MRKTLGWLLLTLVVSSLTTAVVANYVQNHPQSTLAYCVGRVAALCGAGPMAARQPSPTAPAILSLNGTELPDPIIEMSSELKAACQFDVAELKAISAMRKQPATPAASAVAVEDEFTYPALPPAEQQVIHAASASATWETLELMPVPMAEEEVEELPPPAKFDIELDFALKGVPAVDFDFNLPVLPCGTAPCQGVFHMVRQIVDGCSRAASSNQASRGEVGCQKSPCQPSTVRFMTQDGKCVQASFECGPCPAGACPKAECANGACAKPACCTGGCGECPLNLKDFLIVVADPRTGCPFMAQPAGMQACVAMLAAKCECCKDCGCGKSCQCGKSHCNKECKCAPSSPGPFAVMSCVPLPPPCGGMVVAGMPCGKACVAPCSPCSQCSASCATCCTAAPKLVRKAYPVAGLLDCGDECPEDVVRIICRTVAPESWDMMGGRGVIDFFPKGKCLVVCQTEAVHQEIDKLLADLRTAVSATSGGTSSVQQAQFSVFAEEICAGKCEGASNRSCYEECPANSCCKQCCVVVEVCDPDCCLEVCKDASGSTCLHCKGLRLCFPAGCMNVKVVPACTSCVKCPADCTEQACPATEKCAEAENCPRARISK